MIFIEDGHMTPLLTGLQVPTIRLILPSTSDVSLGGCQVASAAGVSEAAPGHDK